MGIVTFTDNSIMPFGMHKGKKLANVPAGHLLWLWNRPTFDKTTPLGRYINDNLEVLKQQERSDNQLRR